MAGYVDGFVIPLKTKNLAAYKRMATAGKKAGMTYDALDDVECLGDDLDNPWGASCTRLLPPRQEPGLAVCNPQQSQASTRRVTKIGPLVVDRILEPVRPHHDHSGTALPADG